MGINIRKAKKRPSEKYLTTVESQGSDRSIVAGRKRVAKSPGGQRRKKKLEKGPGGASQECPKNWGLGKS